MSNFRQQYKKQKQDLLRRHKESVADKGDGQFGSIIDKSKIPKGIGFWKCSDEKHIVDFIPFIAGPNMPKVSGGGVKEGEFTWLVDLWVHWNVGVLEHPYVCPAKTNGEPCPICEYLQQNRDTLTKEEYDKIRAKHRTIYLIWCHDNSTEEEKGVQLWEIAHYFMEYNLKEIAERPRGGGTIPYFDPDTGKNVIFTRRGKGAGNTEFIGHRFDDRENPVIPDRILEQSFPLDSVVKYTSHDKLYEAFYGAKQDGTSNVVEQEAPFETESDVSEETTDYESEEVEVVPDECPANGEFGVDHTLLENCDDCPNWDNCFAANQEMQEADDQEMQEPEPEPITPKRKLRSPAKKSGRTPTPIRRARRK